MWGDFGFHPPPSLQAFVAGAILEALRRSAAATDVGEAEAGMYGAKDGGEGAGGVGAAAADQPRGTTRNAGGTTTTASIATATTTTDAARMRTHVPPTTPEAAASVDPDLAWLRLPPPMHSGLPVRLPLACYVWGINYRLNFKHYGYRLLAPPPTLKTDGWANTLEQRTSRAGALRVNPGLRANVSGAELIVQLDTRRALDALAAADPTLSELAGASSPVVQLEYLSSRDGGMGTLEVSCLSGCTCATGRFDAHAKAAGRGSRHVLGCLPVSEAAACVMRLAVATATSSGEHKFVLHALRVLMQPKRQAVELGEAGGACDASLYKATHTYLR